MITISRPDILTDVDFQQLLRLCAANAAPIAIYTPGIGLTRICWCARRSGNHLTVRPPCKPEGLPFTNLTLTEFDGVVSGSIR